MENPQEEAKKRNVGKEWTTLSLREEVRDELKSIRDDLHSKGHKEFGYSDVIDAIIKLLGAIIYDEKEPLTVGDFILSNLEELK